MAIFAEVSGYVTFGVKDQPARIFDLLNASDDRFSVFESEPNVGLRRQMASFAGEARLSGATDDREWLLKVESRLREIDFLSAVIFISYEDGPAFVCSYFKINGIRKLVSKIVEQPIAETDI